MINESTICAISSPPGAGGVAMIRVSGKNAIGLVNQVASIDLEKQEANRTKFAKIEAEGRVVDECLLTLFKAPHSFTGEDVVEIACHGSIFIQHAILDLLLSQGGQLAGKGEFTKRAYLNHKMDLVQAEAVADLIASESAAEHKMAMRQMRGGLSDELAEIRQKLMDFASLIELELDFSEEDVEFADRGALQIAVQDILSYLDNLIDSFKYGNAIKNGIPVAIVGRPNAGKSTLLNALLKEDRAIVSDIPGTTRDTIEEILVLEGHKFRLVDTAGIRESEDTIEKIGIERSIESVKKADIVLYIYDASELDEKQVNADLSDLPLDDKQVIKIANKTDKSPTQSAHADCQISALNKEGLDQLIKLLTEAGTGQHNSDVILSNVRHLHALKEAHSDLSKVKLGMASDIQGDLLALDIRSALRHIGEITGEVSADDLLGNIFGRFCIGK